MSYRDTQLGSDVRLHPERARSTILQAFRAAGADRYAAAVRLDVCERTLRRYVRRLGLQPHLDRISRRARRPHKANGAPSIARGPIRVRVAIP